MVKYNEFDKYTVAEFLHILIYAKATRATLLGVCKALNPDLKIEVVEPELKNVRNQESAAECPWGT